MTFEVDIKEECIEENFPAFWNVKSKDYGNPAKKTEQWEQLLHKYREKCDEADRCQSKKNYEL